LLLWRTPRREPVLGNSWSRLMNTGFSAWRNPFRTLATFRGAEYRALDTSTDSSRLQSIPNHPGPREHARSFPPLSSSPGPPRAVDLRVRVDLFHNY
jgi:hypothetical protein